MALRTRVFERQAADSADCIAVVPLAIPIVAGPGAITTVLSAASKQNGNISTLVEMLGVCVGFGLLFWLCFRSAGYLAKRLGVAGVAIITRILGMMLAALACSVIAAGSKQLLPGLA